MYDESSLWQQTLGVDHHEVRERLRPSYLATRDHATVLLNEQIRSAPDFTVHDITHVDALWETASMLCGSSVTLTPAEGYVLGCAFILHDAAMGAAGYQESIESALGTPRWHDLLSSFIVAETGNWPTAEELASPKEEIVKACTMHAIRELHAEEAGKLVDQSWKTSAGSTLYLIENTELREWYGPLIGDLARSHWWPVDRLESEFRREKSSPSWLPEEWTVDPLKLACLLRLADATQVDNRRAPTFLFTLRRPEGVSREHWLFQEHTGRPRLRGDRVTYNAAREFKPEHTDAWWLALDYLRGVDVELKKVDALLFDLKRPRFEGRAVAGVETPERFAEYFEVRGWRPVDVRVMASNVPHLVETLGGKQLYGNNPEVALRELLQNAQDATVARKSVDPHPFNEEIVVSLQECNGTWVLEVADNGVGMFEKTLTTEFLDFGRTGWTSDTIREKFHGLVDGGFRPKGRFGIGFYSAFMLGDNIEVVTRPFDSAPEEARKLTFHGVRTRPMLTPVPAEERTPYGTRIRVELKSNHVDLSGIFSRAREPRLDVLVQRLCPEHPVPIRVVEPSHDISTTLAPIDLRTASHEEVFDRLYPARSKDDVDESRRLTARTEFIKRAVELTTKDGARIGMAALRSSSSSFGGGEVQGAVLLNGFRSRDHLEFVGYLEGRPSRASRDDAEPVATYQEGLAWLNSYEANLRSRDLLDLTTQIGLGQTLYYVNKALPDDFVIAFDNNKPLKLTDITPWAAEHDEIFFPRGRMLGIGIRSVGAYHTLTGAMVTLPDGWILRVSSRLSYPFSKILNIRTKLINTRPAHKRTWQEFWKSLSGTIDSLVLQQICAAWRCDIEDILEPVAKRGWKDTAYTGHELIGKVPVYRLNRPTPRP